MGQKHPPSTVLLSMCKPLHARSRQLRYCMSTAHDVITIPCGMKAVLVPVRRFPRLEPVRCSADQGARHVEDIETHEESFTLQRSFTGPFATAPSVVQRASLHIRRDPSLINLIHQAYNSISISVTPNQAVAAAATASLSFAAASTGFLRR